MKLPAPPAPVLRQPLDVGTRTSGPHSRNAVSLLSATRLAIGIAASLALAGISAARADTPPPTSSVAAPFPEVGVDQRLGESIPLDLVFRDETGAAVRLGDLFGPRPVVLTLAYYRCPMLCSLVLNGLASGLKPVSLDPGKDFTMITVSIDPKETPDLAYSSRESYTVRYGHPGARSGWHFLTGDESAIRSLAGAVGFRYAFDAATGQFAHPSVVMVLTPDGRLSRYLMGVEYAPRDLRLALVESSEGKIGTLADALMLLCYRYDPASGRYGALTLRLVRTGGVLTVLAMSIFVLVMLRRDARRVPHVQ